jgi:hypothetical protein
MEATKRPFPLVEHVSRPEAIDRSRRILNALEDDERFACAIASCYGIFCKGFERLSEGIGKTLSGLRP